MYLFELYKFMFLVNVQIYFIPIYYCYLFIKISITLNTIIKLNYTQIFCFLEIVYLNYT